MSEEFIKVILPERFSGKRIDSVLAEMLPNLSRSKITSTIKAGDALLNGHKFKPKDKASGEEIINFKIKIKNNNQWASENISLNIIYEDEDILIINKPSGLVTHPGPGNWKGTLANALLYYNPDLSILDRAGIVHRLDKNTSGLMVVAKNLKSQKYLVEQFQTHSVEREYSAIVYGNMISGGTVNDPIARDPKERIKQAVRVNGKESVTHYRIIDRYENHTHIKALLETGRTHQIRVHLSHIGYPLVGDPLYGGRLRFPKKARVEIKEALKAFQRQALHSKKLTLKHPTSGNEMSWKIELPEDMSMLLNALNSFD
ncbi:23S rRNA pseudouridine(1911/1915/1917) synthase RluD [Candidatus Thioglobus sp.]|nr:23S rRNA pseudouridine(1911/1915/1917) synthase RluD [Candidatus Thioglobus sp.]